MIICSFIILFRPSNLTINFRLCIAYLGISFTSIPLGYEIQN